MTNPYRGRPDYAFWRRAVTMHKPENVDPVIQPPFQLSPDDNVATMGSCFAQHISKAIQADGYTYLVTEKTPQTLGASDENYGVFSARFGNIYTVRQLLQLFLRAYAQFVPVDVAWRRENALVDPFRPRVQRDGFVSLSDLQEDLAAHLSAVREMFEKTQVLIFTLGLTEGWRSKLDGAVFPLAPGVEDTVVENFENYEFVNFNVEEMQSDLLRFVEMLRVVNPVVRIILTVSPVPLVATYENKHVLTATTYSKAALRVVAEHVSRKCTNVVYFPSYEIITGCHQRGKFFAEDLREVTPDGVAQVMRIFRKHYFATSGESVADAAPPKTNLPSINQERREIVCDEESLDINDLKRKSGGARLLTLVHEHTSPFRFLGKPLIDGLHEIHHEGRIIDIFFSNNTSDTLVIFFAAAIPEAKVRTVKWPYLRGVDLSEVISAKILSIGDPVLRRNPGLDTAWHIGDDKCPMLDMQRSVVKKIILETGARRTIIVGASAGGFAALALSAHIPGSLAVVTNPQTDLAKYYPEKVNKFTTAAFGADFVDLPQSISQTRQFSVIPMYWKAKNANYVLYLQNKQDHHHYRKHAMPFLQAQTRSGDAPDLGYQMPIPRLAFYLGDWGQGHVAPPSVMNHGLLKEITKSDLPVSDLFEGGGLRGIVTQAFESDSNVLQGHVA